MLQKDPQRGKAFHDLVQHRLQGATSVDQVSDILLGSWRIVFGRPEMAATAHTVFARWRHAVKYRAIRKTLQKQAVVAKRERLQQQVQAALVGEYFAEVFAAQEACSDFVIREDFHFTSDEFASYLRDLPAHKAVPAHCAPAPLWKWCGEAVSKFTVSCLGGCLRAGSFSAQWPQDWSTSYMCLLPKTAQQLDSVKKMRPISLLHPLGKTFAGLLMGRVREDITQRMLPYPQFAYLRGRSAMDAIDRAMWHVWKTQARTGRQYTQHHRRAGIPQEAMLGSVTLSIDLSRAFDSISRSHIKSSLEWAGIPANVADVILGLHHAMTIQYSAAGFCSRTATGKGVRQGYRALFIRQLRAICDSPVHLTRESTEALLVRVGVDCPVQALAKATEARHRMTAQQAVFRIQPDDLADMWTQVLATIKVPGDPLPTQTAVVTVPAPDLADNSTEAPVTEPALADQDWDVVPASADRCRSASGQDELTADSNAPCATLGIQVQGTLCDTSALLVADPPAPDNAANRDDSVVAGVAAAPAVLSPPQDPTSQALNSASASSSDVADRAVIAHPSAMAHADF
ncbi:unnamed protein product, partial [Symbiodinium necroappetens]